MAVNKGSNAAHMLLRLFGLTGLFVVAAGGLVWYAFHGIDHVEMMFRPEEIVQCAAYAVAGGLGAFAFALLFELPGFFGMMSSRRGAVGGSVFVQIVMALVLVGGINAFALSHFTRFDMTWDHAFTLKPELREQLANLRGDTDIVVVQRNLASGLAGGGMPDRYDIAAPKKIIEKVKDLAEQFSDFGQRFRVQVFDIQDDDFDKKVKALGAAEKKATADKNKATNRKDPEESPLADAIESSTENSIFFKANGTVQRLAFHDVYQTDKVASALAQNGQGNLVLNFQGTEPFARKILNIEEKKPRLALAVVHPALSMTSPEHEMLTMNGAKKYLEKQGFLCKDILLRKQDGDGGLSQEAAAVTFDENRFEQIEESLPSLEEHIAEGDKTYAVAKAQLEAWKTQTLAELDKTYAYLKLPNGQEGVATRKTLAELDHRKIPYKTIPVDEDDRKNEVLLYSRDSAVLERALQEYRKERDTLVKERATLNVDELAEKRRIADVEAKIKRMLADTDLLVVPRFTIFHLPSGQMIPNKVHKIDDAQLRAIKAFLKEGKPVLFLLGPTNEKRDAPPDFGGGGDDDGLEPMLAELGFRLPKQTILYNVEVKEFNERKRSIGFSERKTDVPPPLVDWDVGAGQVNKKRDAGTGANSIRVSLDLLAKSIGDKLMKDLQIRHARPVYVEADATSPGNFDEAAVFLMVGPDTWNESSPFLNEKREPPRYTPTKEGDKAKGSLDEVRRGPFPIAVAVEKTLPKSWFEENEKPATARIGVVGNGGVFVGPTLSPIKEKMLLDVCNWLLGRDDLLAKRQDTWSFPRVNLTEPEKKLWQWGTLPGLPLAFLYLGLFVWFVRRLR